MKGLSRPGNAGSRVHHITPCTLLTLQKEIKVGRRSDIKGNESSLCCQLSLELIITWTKVWAVARVKESQRVVGYLPPSPASLLTTEPLCLLASGELAQWERAGVCKERMEIIW